jgi:hypothetical protein
LAGTSELYCNANPNQGGNQGFIGNPLKMVFLIFSKNAPIIGQIALAKATKLAPIFLYICIVSLRMKFVSNVNFGYNELDIRNERCWLRAKQANQSINSIN